MLFQIMHENSHTAEATPVKLHTAEATPVKRNTAETAPVKRFTLHDATLAKNNSRSVRDEIEPARIGSQWNDEIGV